MEKSEKKITELAKDKGEIDNEDMKVIWGYEPMFGVSIVYCYGTLKACEKLGLQLFENVKKTSASACEQCFFGKGVESIGAKVCLTWIDSDEYPLEHSLPAFMHQIVHIADGILKNEGVEDSSNEIRAYLVERETERVLREMFEMPLPQPSVQATKAIEAILKENFGLAKEEKQQ
ncbi:MAG: hypothetical protein ILM98_16075 [Kiritimatiellae bacterium]|nr:hypothetical protein [Kiritimatiellia bacterium]